MNETMNVEWCKEVPTDQLLDLLENASKAYVLLVMLENEVKRGESTTKEMREYISKLYGEVLTGQKPPEEEAKEIVSTDIASIEHELKKRKVSLPSWK